MKRLLESDSRSRSRRDNIGKMRKTVHRLLSAAPAVALAFAAVWATANPEAAKALFGEATLLLSDTRFFWLGIGVVVAYAGLWWATSLEPKTRRVRLQEGLRPHYRNMSDFKATLLKAADDAEFQAKVGELNGVLEPCAQWIMDNMGDVAFSKFNHPPVAAVGWTWPANPGSGLHGYREQILNLQIARIAVLDLFLQSDAWDGTAITRWQRMKRGWKLKKKESNAHSIDS